MDGRLFALRRIIQGYGPCIATSAGTWSQDCWCNSRRGMILWRTGPFQRMC